MTQVASVAATKYLEKFPVYKIQGKDGKMAAAKLLLKDLEIRDQKIYVTLGLWNQEGFSHSIKDLGDKMVQDD